MHLILLDEAGAVMPSYNVKCLTYNTARTDADNVSNGRDSDLLDSSVLNELTGDLDFVGIQNATRPGTNSSEDLLENHLL